MAIFTGIAAFVAAVGSWTVSLGALGTFAIGNFLLRAAVQLGVSALAKALAKGSGRSADPFAIQGNVRSGGSVPRSFVLGPSLSAGSLAWHSEWGAVGGTPNAYYTQVIALSDVPVAGLRRWFIEGRAVSLEDTGDEKGLAAVEYRENGVDHAWIRFHDGTQLVADPFLVGTVSENAPREYSSTRVGKGIAYAVVTFRGNSQIYTGFPRSKFVLDGVKLYDISKDETQGGVGVHRWDAPETWGGDGDALPAVQAYNLARGIFYRDAGIGGETGESATVSLGAGLSTLSFKMVGGGGGGKVSGDGGSSQIVLKDGEAVVETWIVAGGGSRSFAVSGAVSGYAPHGNGGLGQAEIFEGGSEGYGVIQPAINGGGAGQYLTVSDYDISALTDPVLEITVGAGGGNGFDGYALYTAGLASERVVPQWFYGLQGLTPARLPASHWIAQVEKCRAQIEGDDGLEPIYRCAGEITVNSEIGSAFEAILTACAGRMSEVGGIFKMYVGGPDAPIAHFADSDIVSLAPQSFTPFFGLSETVNGVIASYPSPDEGYVMRSTSPIYNHDFEVEDGNRRLMTDVQLSFVPFPAQAQRLLQGELKAARRARRHTHTLPARFRLVEPGDVVSWTSLRNGYDAKQFRVDGVIDLPNCDLVVDLTEVDPADHGDWDHDRDFRPVEPVPVIPVLPTAQGVAGFGVSAADIQDAAGAARRPGLSLTWDIGVDDIAGLLFEIRLKETGALVSSPETSSFSSGRLLVESGLVGVAGYEVRAKYVPASPRPVVWTSWISVSTNDVRIGSVDLAPGAVGWSELGLEVQGQIDSAGDANVSAQAADIARQASEAAQGGAVAAQGLAVDASEAAIAAAVSSLPAVPAAPVEAWTAQTSLAGSFPRPAISDLRLISGDADFGNCYESTTANAAVGPAQALPFDRSRSYLVRIRVKTFDDGANGGSRVMAGFSTYNSGGGAVQQSNVQVDLAFPLSVADGVQEYSVLIHPAGLGVADLGTFSDFTHTAVHSSASDASDLITFHVRHNAGNSTNGKVRIGLIEVKDVTDVLAANISASASYDAEQAALVHRDNSETFAGAASSAKIASEAARDAASGSASSAAGSASTATSKATEAGNYASAANQSKIDAATESSNASGHRVQAGVHETAAATAASEAADAAAGAIFARDVAARAMGGGLISGDESIFLNGINRGGINKWTHLSGNTATVVGGHKTGGEYGGYWEYSTGSAPAGRPYLFRNLTANDNAPAASSAKYIEVEMDLEMVSGTWGSARVVIQWHGAAYSSDIVYIADQLGSQNGKVQQLKLVFERPDSFSSASGPNEIRFVFYGSANNADDNDHTARIHRVQCRTVSKAANALIQQKAITDLEGNAEASLVFRAKAGAATGAVEIVAASNAAGAAASKVKLTGDEIELDGLAVFKNGIQSDDYVPGVSGYHFGSNHAEMQNLVVRDWVQVGAVSDGVTFVDDTARSKGNGSNISSTSLGSFELGQFWQIAVRFRARCRGRTDTYLGQDKDGNDVWSTTWSQTLVHFQMRKDGGDWETEYSSGYTPANNTWQDHEFVTAKQGVFGNVDIRLKIYVNNGTGWTTSYTNIDDVSIVARALVR